MSWISLGGKRLIKAQEMEDLFCIKYLEKDRSPHPLVITKCQGMVFLMLWLLHKDEVSFNPTHIPTAFWTPTFCLSRLCHLFQSILFSSARKFFPKCSLKIIDSSLKITVAPTMLPVNDPSVSSYSVNTPQGIRPRKSRQAASQAQISLTCFQNHLFTIHSSLGSYLEMLETGLLGKENLMIHKTKHWRSQTFILIRIHYLYLSFLPTSSAISISL